MLSVVIRFVLDGQDTINHTTNIEAPMKTRAHKVFMQCKWVENEVKDENFHLDKYTRYDLGKLKTDHWYK